MKKLKKKEKKTEQQVPVLPLTPMIDCTFLLLIFFMLACRFRSQEGKLLAHLPKNSGLNTTPPGLVDIDKIRVKLLWFSPEGQGRYNRADGHLVLKVGEKVFSWTKDERGNDQPDWTALGEYAQSRKLKYKPPPESPEKTITAIIDARKAVPFYWIVRTMDTLLENDIKDIEFAAPEIPY